MTDKAVGDGSGPTAPSAGSGWDELDAQDPAALAATARLGRRDLYRLGTTLGAALQIVRAAGPSRARTGGLLQVVIAVLLVLQLLLARSVLELLVQGESADVGRSAAFALIGLALAVGLGQAATSVLEQQQRLLGEQVTRTVWGELLDVASRVPLQTFEDADFRTRLERVRAFALVRPLEVTAALGALVNAGLSALAMLFVLVVLEPLLVPVLLLAAIPLLVFGRTSSREEFRFAVGQTLNLRRRLYLSGLLTDRERGKEVRAFSLAEELLRRYLRLYDEHVDVARGHARRQSRRALLGTLVSSVALTITFLLLLALVRNARLTLPEAAVAALVLRLLAGRLQSFAAALGKIFGAGLFLQDLLVFLALKPPPAAARPSAEGTRIQVEATGLTYRYPDSERPAVKDVELVLRPGEIVALVGENGSGKTTLAKLVAGLYTPSEGDLAWRVDGVEVDDMQVREHLTVLFQDFGRYELSVRDNVTLGRPDRETDDGAVFDALHAADASAIVEALPHGLDTVLSTAFAGGVDLSVGQWQRIALARCFYRAAPLIILDEPTSALDPRAEHELFADLRRLLAGRTVLLISHRFSNVRSADRIHVMEEGAVVESGTHEELMRLGGRYADLYTLQARAYGLGQPAGEP